MKLLTPFMLLTLTGLFSVALANSNECFECHQELSNTVKHKAAEISCSLCHTDHGVATPNSYRLKKPVTEMCQTCHTTVNVRHFPAEHPDTGIINPAPPQNNFTCVSCHNPHQSKMPKLIRYDYERKDSPYRGYVCTICHPDILGLPANVPMPRGSVYGDPE